MSRSRTYFPNYQLQRKDDRTIRNKMSFEHDGTIFTIKAPLFGATKTQKFALEWAVENKMPPIISVRHDAPTAPDKKSLTYPGQDLHFQIYPYAMVFVTLECLGEDRPRGIKIYFCDEVIHYDNAFRRQHTRSKKTYVEVL